MFMTNPFILFPTSTGGGGVPTNGLLLHCDGTDGSTSFPDSSDTGHTVTANGDAQVDTAQSKFGGGSLLLDGTGDYLSVPSSSDFNFGSGDFTIDLWLRLASGVSTGTSYGLIQRGTSFSTYIYYNGASSYLEAQYDDGNIYVESGTRLISTETWYHVAYVRNGSDFRVYIDGTDETFGTGGSGTIADTTDAVNVGEYTDGNKFSGHMDEVRILKGQAAWTGNFTPPTSAYS